MSSLDNLPKPGNDRKAEFEIERGDTKVSALIPEGPFVKICCAIVFAVLTYFLIN